MSLLLNIDTASNIAVVSIAKDGYILQEATNKEQKDHASFLHIAIKSICQTAGVNLNQLNAIAVVAGPGSYTGLRVGMASAKGLCYTLHIPLIAIGALELIAWQAINETKNLQLPLPVLFCPMIDARRMEVFTAIFDANLQSLLKPTALVLENDFFANFLLTNKIVFSGNGSTKWREICSNANAYFIENETNALYMSQLSYNKFINNKFEDIAYVQPLYVKEFFNPS
ncbi:MAG: TsaB protein required for threonylcarbamoyladenosine ((6)A) formation in tRNA [Ferruginibacter sp.]|uniref:tRNA (adenosine(37)-N6)-threonylcarbamoyltransferase complex dimerization subunit type 1 TsaB n=1 Tax=Ferruginibacter sp. TaxID=1940288 RepID=UPI0026590496|nr:tRNA (adenosine(37)-N6)-threonylcarbamoyltransferase complex dimerization subunit type 1 TsaB [Ferruginibacter sp.]MDB5275060.1 TsaB protein required for threonylcarbamoyladenosine ((6)A) formation in tRNA [Ferruginibacter sp.]